MDIRHIPELVDQAIGLFNSLMGHYDKSTVVKDSESTLGAISKSIDFYEDILSMTDSIRSQISTDTAILQKMNIAFTAFDNETASKMKIKSGAK